VLIRQAQVADANEIARLSGVLGYPSTEFQMERRLSILLVDPRQFVAVAPGSDGRLTGWLAAEQRLLLESGQKAEIVGLVVEPSERRTGVGAALVNAAERWAERLGLGRIVVRSNLARVESHSFYESIGYKPTKTQQAYAKELSVQQCAAADGPASLRSAGRG